MPAQACISCSIMVSNYKVEVLYDFYMLNNKVNNTPNAFEIHEIWNYKLL